jgi:DNA excision repair protein ERCC-3
VGLETDAIIEVLNRLSKVPVPDSIVKFIRECTLSYGKVKLVLKHNKYYIESSHPEVLQILLKDSVIRDARVLPESGDTNSSTAGIITNKVPKKNDTIIAGTKPSGPNAEAASKTPVDELFASVIGVQNGWFSCYFGLSRLTNPLSQTKWKKMTRIPTLSRFKTQ